MLVAFGEFLRNNLDSLPSAWCEEWWIQTITNSTEYTLDIEKNKEDLKVVSKH